MTTWDQTNGGQNLQTAFNNMLDAYQRALPAHLQSLTALTVRSISG